MLRIVRWIRSADKCDFVTDQRAWVLLVTNIVAALLAVGILVVSGLLRTTPFAATTRVAIFVVLGGALASTIILESGRYRLAAHVTVGLFMLGIWYVNVINAAVIHVKSDPVYMIAGLIVPALLLGPTCTIVYGLLSLILVGYMTFVLTGVEGLDRNHLVGFAVDNSVAIIFVVFFSSAISAIYHRALRGVHGLLEQQQRQNEELLRMKQLIEESESQKRQFYRDTIYSITDGKLIIRDEVEVRPLLDSAEAAFLVPNAAAVCEARHHVADYLAKQGLDDDRVGGFIIGVGEALTNAVKHADGGKVYAGRNEEFAWIAVEDHGPGIESLTLPRAVLLKGFSTKPSLGIGYSVILEIADRVLLKSDSAGTTVVLFIRIQPVRQETSHGHGERAWDRDVLSDRLQCPRHSVDDPGESS